MIFPSYIFLLVFLPVVLSGWYLLKSTQLRLAFLTLMSYTFYGWLDYRFVVLMLASTLLDYHCGRKLHQTQELSARRAWLVVSICGNLGALGFFKYFGFFTESLQTLLAVLNVQVSLPLLQIALPLGISFYTFQSMSYTIDIYRGRSEPTGSVLLFTAYVSMFPQLVAGPIVRYGYIQEQLTSLSERKTDYAQISDGIWLFVIGLVKKIWIADALAPVANFAFDSGGPPQLVTAWVGTLCYTLQLYFDFSAYSDMARGLGFMMGFTFPVNFNSPYKSGNVAEFWNRWHITLSQWLRDYIYIPLGGSRRGTTKTLRNLGITLFLGGLWHGAAWTFVLWGLYHGFLLMVHECWTRISTFRMPTLLAVPGTFMCIMIGWVLFRAGSMEGTLMMLSGMVGLHGIEPFTYESAALGIRFPEIYAMFSGLHGVAFLVGVTAIAFLAPNSEQIPRPRHPAFAVALAMVVLVTLTTFMEETPFLYFRF